MELNPDYWDCECESDYIHKKAEVKFCGRCVTYHSDQPDSRQSEVDKILKAEKVRAELEAIKEACTPIYEDIAEWESKKL